MATSVREKGTGIQTSTKRIDYRLPTADCVALGLKTPEANAGSAARRNMVARLRRYFDIRPGEGLPVLLSFSYIGVVIASYVLARAIRSGLFIQAYGPFALVYVAAASPMVLSLFVPAYTILAARLGSRLVTTATLLFFSLNVLVFWYAFNHEPTPRLTAVFYVWVNCFGVIAPVHAWSYASSLFDTRQAKRLFGLIGSGASLGAIVGGFLARMLVEPLGGSTSLLLVLALLIMWRSRRTRSGPSRLNIGAASRGSFVLSRREKPARSRSRRSSSTLAASSSTMRIRACLKPVMCIASGSDGSWGD